MRKRTEDDYSLEMSWKQCRWKESKLELLVCLLLIKSKRVWGRLPYRLKAEQSLGWIEFLCRVFSKSISSELSFKHKQK